MFAVYIYAENSADLFQLSNPSGSASVIRQCTVDMVNRLNAVKEGTSDDEKRSYTLSQSSHSKAASSMTREADTAAGERGSGKSMLLLQTVAHALNSGFIVLYVPKCTFLLLDRQAFSSLREALLTVRLGMDQLVFGVPLPCSLRDVPPARPGLVAAHQASRGKRQPARGLDNALDT
jgi:hypothetical protein